MAINLPSCSFIQFLEQLLKFLVNFTLLKYVKSQRSYGFLIAKELIWLPNFGFKRSLLTLLKNLFLVLFHSVPSVQSDPIPTEVWVDVFRGNLLLSDKTIVFVSGFRVSFVVKLLPNRYGPSHFPQVNFEMFRAENWAGCNF